jgi:hypothetical protein
VDIIYCEYGNLFKAKGMEAGAVSYKNEKANVYVRGVSKDREILKKIEKTRLEKSPDLKQLRSDRDLEFSHKEKKRLKDLEAEKKALEAKKKADDDILHYVSFQNRDDLKQRNRDWAGDGSVEHCKKIEEDFM